MPHVQLMQFDSAEEDCDKALKLELSVKTLLRRGTARRGKQDVEGARRDFKHALSLEPNNRSAQRKDAPCACSDGGGMHALHLPYVLHRHYTADYHIAVGYWTCMPSLILNRYEGTSSPCFAR